jgi:hypothetical protein
LAANVNPDGQKTKIPTSFSTGVRPFQSAPAH